MRSSVDRGELRRERRLFELLKRAYVEARYSGHFAISREELTWLAGRTRFVRTDDEYSARLKRRVQGNRS